MLGRLNYDSLPPFSKIENIDHDTKGEEVVGLIDEGSTNVRRNTHQHNQSNFWLRVSILGLASLVVLESLVITLLISKARHTFLNHIGPHDFPNIQPAIGLENRRFTSAIRILDNGTLEFALDPAQPRYVGPPSPEIDQNWDDLTEGRYIKLTNEEVEILNKDTAVPDLQPFSQRLPNIKQAGVYGGIDMMHSLHCVNAVRKHLDLEYYKDLIDLPVQYRRMHIEHCIDQLRQAVMCHGDTTPVTLKPIWLDRPSIGLLGETERTHTCRNSKMLRDWVTDRGTNGLSIGRM